MPVFATCPALSVMTTVPAEMAERVVPDAFPAIGPCALPTALLARLLTPCCIGVGTASELSGLALV
ncbi:hypothetical protein GO279_04939 [Ralstonia solanacearum]|nr:hypothetical protein [Ralstonia solanacearum]NKA86423.1 hypothetical protein [Ralstonia solanacearum]NKF57841.1 hypothetical protein [Ralstonia solanacearum]NKF62680.1 hypothetical protein [Ralstonia solanacearum]NKF67746.1 hypothetical protein [Ralstonia solanacearum]